MLRPRNRVPSHGCWRRAGPAHRTAEVLDGTAGITPYRAPHLSNAAPWRRLLGEAH